MTESAPRLETEVRSEGEVPLWQLRDWVSRFPWLVQGITGRGEGEFDLGLFGSEPVGAVLERWDRLRETTGMRRVVHSRQVHASELRTHGPGDEPGLLLGRGYDGHLTRSPGVLLTVSVADCVPVYLVDESNRSLSILHAGWRGVAAGIVEKGVERLRAWHREAAGEIWLHCGPAICGSCYEVGPEVHTRVRPAAPAPVHPAPIDLRTVIAGRAVQIGIAPERISVSAHCTKCGPPDFFSHRSGSGGRQIGIIGIRT